MWGITFWIMGFVRINGVDHWLRLQEIGAVMVTMPEKSSVGKPDREPP